MSSSARGMMVNLKGNQQLLSTLTQILVESGSLQQDLVEYCHRLEQQVAPSDAAHSAFIGNSLEAHQYSIFDAAPDAIALCEAECITYVNPQHLHLFGYSAPEQLLGKPWQILYSQEEARRIETDILPQLLPDQGWQGETYAQRQGGEAFIAEMSFSLAQPTQILMMSRDVTQQAYAESWQDAQTTILKQLATGTPTLEVLETIVDSLECHLLGGRGTVLLIDSWNFLRLGVAPHLPPEMNSIVEEIKVSDTGGLLSQAAFSKEPVISELNAYSPLTTAEQLAIDQGFQSCWSFPILDSQIQAVGIMAVYFKTPRVPTEYEQKFIDIALDLAGIALEQQQSRAQQAENSSNILRSNAELQAIFDTFPDLLLRVNSYGTLLSFKGRHHQDDLFDQPEAFLGKQIQSILPEEISKQFLKALTEVLESQQIHQFEYSLSRDDITQYYEARLLPSEQEQVLALIRNVSDRKRAELAVSGLFKGTSRVTGDDFFQVLVQEIATTLNMSEVMLSQVEGEALATLAFYSDGKMQPNVLYPISHTPCEITLRDGAYCCERGVQTTFPEDLDLIHLQAESYIGYILKNSSGKPIGVLCSLSSSPIPDGDFANSILQIFGARAGAELERLQGIKALEQLNSELEARVRSRTLALQQSQQDLRTILNTAYDGIYIHTLQGQLIDVNQRTLEIHGLTRDQILQMNLTDLVSEDSQKLFQKHFQQAEQGISLQFEDVAKNFQDSMTSLPVEIRIRKVALKRNPVLITTLSDISRRKQQQHAIESIVKGTADKTGSDFYQSCVRYLANIFRVHYAFVAKIKDETWTQSRVLAMWTGDSFATPYDFDLDGTPCLETYRHEWCCVPNALSAKFPTLSRHLSPQGESYISCLIKNSQGQVIGNLGIIDTKPLPIDTSNLEFVLQLFATRVGAEMERQASEDALRRSQKLLQAVIDNSPAAIYLKDLEGRYLIFNQVLGELFDIDPKTFLGKTDFDLFPQQIAEKLRKNDCSILAAGQAQAVEEVVTHADGSRHTYIANQFPVFDAQGQVYAVGGVSTNISDRKRAENQLRESQLLLRLVIDNIPQLIYWKDHDSVYLGCNQNFAESVGLETPEQVIGKTDSDLVRVNEYLAENQKNDERILSSGIPELHVLQVFKTEKNETIWADTNKIPLKDDFDNTVGILGTYEDISDRKAAEQSLLRQAEVLQESLHQLQATQTELAHNELTLRNQADALLQLSRIKLSSNQDLVQCLQELTEVTAKTLEVERVSIWFLDPDYTKITCIDLFESEEKKHSQGAKLFAKDYPSYFVAISNDPILAAENAYTHPATREFSANYLQPLNIGAMLDSSFLIEGTLAGVICCEHRGGARPWTQSEQNFVRAVSNLVSLFTEADKRLQQSIALTQALNELRESKQFLELVFDTLPQRVFWKDRHLNYQGCNKLFLEDAGLDSLDQIIGKSDFDQIWQNQAEMYQTDDLLVMNKEISRINYEEEQTREDGSIFWLRTNKIPLQDAENNIVGVFGSYEDITPLKEAEQSLKRANEKLEDRVSQRTRELQESQQLLQLVMDTIPQAIFWKDRDFRFLGCNQSFLSTTGLTTADELIGKTDYEMPWSTEADGYRHYDQQIITTQKPKLGFVESMPQKNGETIWIETNKAPFYDAEGGLIGVLGTFQDITHRKQAEEALQTLNQELQRAKEEADAANRAKSDFLANMSHELRTPLNGILGYAQILKRDHQTLPYHQQALNTIHQSGEHLLTLIDDILDIAKIEARKLELNISDIHFPSLLESIVNLVRMRAQDKNIQFVYQPPDSLPKGIQADKKCLRQILLNLLSNAIKFTDRGQVTLSVEIEQQTLQQVRLKFTITDTGIGISPDQIEQIFRPFEQVGELHRRAEGTGLGLSISRQLVELMGGTLHAKSCLAKGSTFWFSVPFKSSEQFVPDQAVSGPIVGYAGPPRRLLIVDDSAVNRSVLVAMLEPLGFLLELAEDGQQGLEKALECKPELILSDLVMPNKDGWVMIKEIRQIPELKKIPIFAISASVQAVDQQQSQDAGCDAFIPKPIEDITLYDLLAEYLQLEWHFASSTTVQTTNDSDLSALVVPDQDCLQQLFELAMLGNMTQIRREASNLVTSKQQFAPFANQLISLAQNFEDEKIMVFLQQYLSYE